MELKSGRSPIFEEGLTGLLKTGLKDKRLSFTSNLPKGVVNAQAIFLALPTPPNADGSADLSAVLDVAAKLGNCLPRDYCVVINKSTVPVGTADAVRAAIKTNAHTPFDVVSNPEFLREGVAVTDFLHPERIVVGVDTPEAEAVMRSLYAPLLAAATEFFVTTPATAELSKYAANTFLTTKINFMNEIAQLCELMDADVDSLRNIIGSDSRIGPKFLHPGIGAGGSCFPKDVRALKHMADSYGYNFRLIEAAIAVNQRQHHVLVDKIKDHFDGDVSSKTFALWGLSFKPHTDDIRESPALYVLDELLSLGARVVTFDPEANANVARRYHATDEVTLASDKYSALTAADALIIGTDWPEFGSADMATIKSALTSPVIFDGRNVYDTARMQAAGFDYYSIGRRPVLAAGRVNR